jgi:hypothetical protein
LIKSHITMEFVYHFKSHNFKGKSILPLSMLENKYQSIYNNEIKKYKDREQDLNRTIRCFNTNWKNVVSFSTINPIIVLTMAELIGLKTNKEDIFKIPISKLGKDICLYDGEKEYKKIKKSEYDELKEVPKETIKHFMDCKKNKELPLIFEGVPHILVADEVDISDAELIKYVPGDLVKLASMFVKISGL